MSGRREGQGGRKRAPGPKARAGRRRRSVPEAPARRPTSAAARQAVFRKILRELAGEDDFERLLSLIGERICRLLGTDGASVLLVDDGELVLRGSYGFEESMRARPRRKVADSRAGRVVLTGRPQASADMQRDPHWRDARIVRQLGYRAVLEAPIRLRGGVVGVLAALQKTPRVFSGEDVSLLTALADHTASALDRTNLLRELQVRLRETQTLLSVRQAVSTTVDLTETLRRVARETARSLGADAVGAFLADRDEEWLRPVAGYHVPKVLLADVEAWTIPLRGHPFFEAAWASRRPLVAADAATDPRLRRLVLARLPVRSLLFVPMVVKEAPIGGLLVVWSDRARVLSGEELRLVEGIGRQAGLAVDNARLFAARQEEAEISRALLTLAEAIGGVSDLDRVLDTVVRLTPHLLGLTRCGLFLWDPAGDVLVPTAAWGLAEELRPAFRGLTGPPRIAAVRRAIESREPVVVDASTVPEAIPPEIAGPLDIRSVLILPLLSSGRLMGTMAVDSPGVPHVFTPKQIAIARGLAAHAAVAIDHVQLYADAERRRREAEVVAELARALGASLDLGTVLLRVVQAARDLCDGDLARIALRDPTSGAMVLCHWVGDEALTTAPGASGEAEVLRTGRPVRTGRDAGASGHAVAELAVPIRIGERIEGVLFVAHRAPRPFGDRDEAILLRLADHAGIAIQNVQLYAETERRRRTAEALAAVGRLLSETLEASVVGQRIAESVRGLLAAHASTLYLLGEGSPRFAELATSGDAFPRGTGLVSVTVGTRRPVVTPDLLADPRATPTPEVRAALERSGFRAVLAVPLTVKDRVIGALAVADRTGRVFDAEAIALAQTFADQAAVALENARLFGETGERLRETETLLAVAQILSRSLPLDEAMRQVARAVGRAFDADMVGAYFLDAGREALVPVAGYRVPKAALPALLQTPFPLARFPILREAWETRRPVWTADYGRDERVDPQFMAGMQPRALLFAPTPVRGEVVGGLFLAWWTATRTFSPAELRLIEGVASQVGLALENAELVRQTQEKLQETETLLTVSRALSSTLDLQPLLRHFLRQVARTIEADSVGVWLVDEATGELEPHTGYRVPQPILDRVRAYRIRPAESSFYAEGIASRRAVVSTDVPGDARIPASLKAVAPHRAQLFVPIVARERVVGAFIAVWWERTREFSEPELALVEAMGSQAGVALENARLFQAHQRKLEELSVLHELSRAVTGQLDIERLVQTVYQQVGRVLDAHNMVLFFFDGAKREFEVALRMFDGPPDPNPVRRYPMGAGLMSRVVERRQAIRTTDYGAACRAEGVQPVKNSLTLPHWLGVPMIAGDEILGVLALRDAARPFTEADERLLVNIAGVAALALRGARLFTEKTRAHDELRAAQDQLIRSEKLRALGEMAAGVAHDFNNVLAAIMGRAQLLLTQIEEPGYRRQLQIVERAAMDGARTVRRIQEFTRMRRARPFEPVDLNQVLDEVVEVTRSRWEDEALARGITYDVRAEPTPLPSIAADPSEIREVLTNLVLNALDAMPDGGSVTLRTSADGEYVVCTVTDTGIGMTEEVRQRVFDPFFTTKAEKGTGLGLSVAYGIITRHDGEIEVQSQPWHGSTFTIRLPAVRRALAPRSRGEVPAAARSARVLIVEDEESVRQVLAEMLMAQGHTVAAHADGRSGLARFHDEPFDVVFTDLGLPGLSGWEVARLVKVRRPETPVVLVTGWSDQIEPEELHWRGIDFVVAKPFEVEDIRAVLARALARAGG